MKEYAQGSNLDEAVKEGLPKELVMKLGPGRQAGLSPAEFREEWSRPHLGKNLVHSSPQGLKQCE